MAAAGIIALALPLKAQELPYTYSWVGNTFGTGSGAESGKWVQNNTVDIYVKPSDGTVYTASQWDEAKREAGIYRNGDVVGRLQGLHPNEGGKTARAVTGNASYIYVANGAYIRRYNFSGSFAPFAGGLSVNNDGGSSYQMTVAGIDGAYGLACDPASTKLYCAMRTTDEIVVMNTSNMTELQRFGAADPFRIAVAPNGEIWVSTRNDGTTGGVIRCYSSSGVLQSRQITRGTAFDPTDIDFDHLGRLLIADNGTAQRVFIYNNLTTSPTPAGTLGTDGGYLAAPVPGLYGPLRFNGLVGVGGDAAGNTYVGQNMSDPDHNSNSAPFGCLIESYSSTQALNWEVKSLAFVDGLAIDRQNGGQAGYLKMGRFQLNFDASGEARESSFRAFSMDRFSYPLDPRWTYRFSNTVFWPASEMRTVSGHKLVFLNEMWGRMTAIYRFDGEIMVPSAFIYANVGENASSSNHPGRPDGTWFWRDLDGDGAFEAGEYTSIPANLISASRTAYFDEGGAYWLAKFAGSELPYVYRVNITSFDTHGNPIYNFAGANQYGPFSDFQRMPRVDYDTATDRMIIAGYTPAQPSGSLGTFSEKTIGKVIARIDGATGPSPTVVWQVTLQNINRAPASMRAEGAYVFVTHDGNEGATDSGFVDIYRMSDGGYVGKIKPPSNTNGRVDITHGLEVLHRPGPDIYEIFVEDDWHAKIALFRWNPGGNPPPHQELQKVVLTPTADSFVRGGSSANINYGSDVGLTIKSVSDPSFRRESYLKFDLSSLSQISAAKLVLVQTALGTENTQQPIARLYQSTSDSWTESGITWNNRPASGPEITSFLANATGVEYELDVTSRVASELGGDHMATFILKQNSDVNRTVTFGSKENLSSQPLLEVTVGQASIPPEADAYVRSGSSANNNYGSQPELVVRDSASVDNDRVSYLRFNLASLTASVSSAKLKLVKASGGGGNTFLHSVSNDSWTESGVTWNNRPVLGAQVLQFATGTAMETFQLDITAAVNAQIAANGGDGRITIGIQQTGMIDTTNSYASKEALINRPTILIEP